MSDHQKDKPTPEQIKTAWVYYQHADSLQHQRHNIFILAQTILSVAYLGLTQSPAPTKVLLASIGAAYAMIWFMLTERVSGGMRKLSGKYLEEDSVYKDYLDSLGGIVHGRTILNRVMPLTTLLVWISILIWQVTR